MDTGNQMAGTQALERFVVENDDLTGATLRINALLHRIPHWHCTLPLENLTSPQCVFARCGADLI